MKSLSRVRLFATPWTAAYQAPLSMGFFQASVLEWGAIAFSIGAFYPFTFKVIIDKYDPVATYFMVLGSSFYTLSVFPV